MDGVEGDDPVFNENIRIHGLDVPHASRPWSLSRRRERVPINEFVRAVSIHVFDMLGTFDPMEAGRLLYDPTALDLGGPNLNDDYQNTGTAEAFYYDAQRRLCVGVHLLASDAFDNTTRTTAKARILDFLEIPECGYIQPASLNYSRCHHRYNIARTSSLFAQGRHDLPPADVESFRLLIYVPNGAPPPAGNNLPVPTIVLWVGDASVVNHLLEPPDDNGHRAGRYWWSPGAVAVAEGLGENE